MKRHLTLLIVAGLAASVGAQPDTRTTAPAKQPGDTRTNIPAHQPGDTRAAMTGTGDFRTCKWIKDRDIINASNETIGEVSDLLVDRGSGTIEYAVVKTGTILGMGGRTIAVPLESLGWNPAKDKFTMAATADQLKTYPKWSEEDWGGLVTSGKHADRKTDGKAVLDEPSTFGDDYNSNRDAHPRTWDLYGTKLDTSKPTRIEGEVRSVDRTYMSEHGEQVVATVKTTSGATQKVALGPSWYVNGAEAMPQRGDKITIDAVQAPGGVNGEPMMVASTVHLQNKDYKLRDQTGAAWSQPYYESGGHSYAEPYYRYIPLSKVKGAKIDCNGTDCGKIDDVVVDVAGAVAFLSIDPNENFLGIGDTKRLVPWTVATIGVDGGVRIDATKEMILGSPETPSDLASLNYDGIYKTYQVTPPSRYEDRRYHTGHEADATPVNPR